jgi:hypothetical protein
LLERQLLQGTSEPLPILVRDLWIRLDPEFFSVALSIEERRRNAFCAMRPPAAAVRAAAVRPSIADDALHSFV